MSDNPQSGRSDSTGTLGRVAEKVSSAAQTVKQAAVPESSGEKRKSAPPARKAPQRPASVKTTRKPGGSRTARLRLVQVDPWSVMKTSFLLSIAIGIVIVVAVGVVWAVLGASGVFESVNDIVRTIMGDTFDVYDYIGTGRVMGFTMILAVANVVLMTAIASLAAFLYNLAATLLGGIEVTLAEDN